MASQQSREYKYPPPIGKRNSIVPLPFYPKQHKDTKPNHPSIEQIPNVPVGITGQIVNL